MTDYTVRTTEGRLKYSDVNAIRYTEHGVKLVEVADYLEEDHLVAFLPYENFVSLEPDNDER